jgi:hypothetical protein
VLAVGYTGLVQPDCSTEPINSFHILPLPSVSAWMIPCTVDTCCRPCSVTTRGSVPIAMNWRAAKPFPLPSRSGASECESTGGKFAAAARQSVGSTPASSAKVPYLGGFPVSTAMCAHYCNVRFALLSPVCNAHKPCVLGAPHRVWQETTRNPRVASYSPVPIALSARALYNTMGERKLGTSHIPSCHLSVDNYL